MKSKILVSLFVIYGSTFSNGYSISVQQAPNSKESEIECPCNEKTTNSNSTFPVPGSCVTYYECVGKDSILIHYCGTGEYFNSNSNNSGKCTQSIEPVELFSSAECKNVMHLHGSTTIQYKRFQACKIKATLLENEIYNEIEESALNSQFKVTHKAKDLHNLTISSTSGLPDAKNENIETTSTTTVDPLECNVVKVVVYHFPGPCKAEITCKNGSSFKVNKCLNTLTFISQYTP